MHATLAELRRSAGFTQRKVADSLGITPGAVSAWEGGFSLPSGPNLLALAELYGLDAERTLELLRERFSTEVAA